MTRARVIAMWVGILAVNLIGLAVLLLPILIWPNSPWHFLPVVTAFTAMAALGAYALLGPDIEWPPARKDRDIR